MPINLSALDKFNAAASYAQDIHDNPTGGDDVVIHLQNGEELACNYSQTDAPRSMKHFLFLRSGGEKRLNDETRAVFKQAVIGEGPVGAEGDYARRMLEANAALREKPGTVLCQDPETKAFAAIRSIPLQIADPDALLEAVDDLVKTAEAWR